jgi:hypothetical protein
MVRAIWENEDMNVKFVQDVCGVAVNMKLNDQGEVEGYFLAEFEEDLTSLDEATVVAKGLFCIESGLVDENGDPDISMLKEFDS